MSVQHFDHPDDLSRDQRRSEIDEALRVRALSPAEFSRWLTAALTPLQDLAGIALAESETPLRPQARKFASFEEKNRHEQQQELARAVRLAQRRKAHDDVAGS